MLTFFGRRLIKIAIICIAFGSIGAFAQDQAPAATPTDAQDQTPAIRPKYDIELNKESSSFVVDPDSLDPLPLKKESLKEDDEPVLEDIKSILKQKTKVSKSNQVSGTTTVDAKKKVKRRKKNNLNSPEENSNRSPDDPDFALEKKFNDIYAKYNINPTSDQVWGAVSSKAANIYTVQKGETLSIISRTLFGDPQFWPKIWALNNDGITNPHIIEPNTKIFFYPGEAGAAPSLSVGQPSEQQLADNADEPRKRDTKLVQHTEFNKLTDVSNDENKISRPFQNIPQSLPALSGLVKKNVPTQTKILLSPRQEIADRDPINPLVLTSVPLASEYKVSEKNANELVCKSNQYVPAVTKIDKGAEPGRYSMLAQETFNFKRLKKTYVYRVIGEADVSSDESLRISECISPVNTDLILIKTEDLNRVRPPTELIPNTRSQIIEGVEVSGQDYFYAHQFVILNMSQLPALEGADLKVFSATAGGVVGEVRILKRTGTMAIGYVMKNNDVVQVGDRVIIPE